MEYWNLAFSEAVGTVGYTRDTIVDQMFKTVITRQQSILGREQCRKNNITLGSHLLASRQLMTASRDFCWVEKNFNLFRSEEVKRLTLYGFFLYLFTRNMMNWIN